MTARSIGARVIVLLLSIPLLLGVASVAGAQEEEPTTSVRGTLRESSAGTLEGVDIAVTTPDGEEVGTATTNDRGQWEVAVPGPGTYVVEVVEATLPEGIGLRDPAANPAEVEVEADDRQPVAFSLGEGTAAGSFLQRFLNTTVNGIQFGLIIAITAIGLSLIYGTTGLVNFAHGELVTFGAVAAWFFNSPAHFGGRLHIVVAGALALVVAGLLGAGLERGLWRPLRQRRAGLIQMLVISIGLSLLLRNLLQLAFGGRSQQYFDYNLQTNQIDLGPISLLPRDMWILGLSLTILVGIGLMLSRSRVGKAMRAVADNRDLAESSGINVQRVILVVWVLGTALAAFGGILTGLDENVSYLTGFRLLLLMFSGIILGGIGTAYGALVGSMVVGLVTEWSTLVFSTELKITWALVVMVIVLLVRPQGILGQRERFG